MTDDPQNPDPQQRPAGGKPASEHDRRPPEPDEGGRVVVDRELEDYRTMLDQPTEYLDGFGWTTVFGALFCGLLMFPGAIYLGLLSGLALTDAAKWVTVIIFSEVARRAMKPMNKQQMVVLLMVAGAMISGNALMPGGPFGHLVWKQYLVTSDAVKDAGLYGKFPGWYAPDPNSAAIQERTFFHVDWLAPIGFVLFMATTGFIERFTLGYALFRLTSDVEKLPFPLAPVGAQGMMALSEGQSGERTWRWTVFSIGTVMGLGFGFIQNGIPAISSAFLEKPILPIPIPWLELTPVTETFMPATPTGLVIDLALILVGMVIPFWAIMGSLVSALLTFILNPALYHAGVLTTWQPGMDTVNATIANTVDFYFSLGLGMSLGLAIVSIYQTIVQLRRSLRELKAKKEAEAAERAERGLAETEDEGSIWDTPPGRGDWSLKLCFIGYFISAGVTVWLCHYLVPQFSYFFLIAFAFGYTPLVSYINARLSGIAGQTVDIPFVREGFILLSQVKGVTPWLVPLPIENYGGVADNLRTFELTGTKLTSKIKAWMLTTPLVLLLGFLFWSFLWADSPIPSDLYPYAQKMWDLNARRQMIMWSATTGEEGVMTMFDRAFKPEYIGAGTAFTVVMFTVLSFFGAPTMMVYGMIRGLGLVPHHILAEVIGAFIAKLYLHKKFGKKPFLQMAPVLLAGYFSGVGLIGMAAVAIRLIMAGISQSPL